MQMERIVEASAAKMRLAGIQEPPIAAFSASLRRFLSGDSGLTPDESLSDLGRLPRYEELEEDVGPARTTEMLRQVAVIKLNGGLGTSMGLERAKSLIRIKDNLNFLDVIARQILRLRKQSGTGQPSFFLMNSFSTQKDSLEYLLKYPELTSGEPVDFLQSMAPKLDASTLLPVEYPADPGLEWCPPGHGDIYVTLLTTGILDQLLAQGIRFLFVSNSDNLGASLDLRVASHFANSGKSFLMEVAERTSADRKGGHLARRLRDGRLILRESAQVPKSDETAFQDIAKHRYFNTNNLWIRLDDLKEHLVESVGCLPLPLIRNVKTVDPRNSSSRPVIQLESAMGAAIECFSDSGAVIVPRTRFSPVKTTSDLLSIRSDAFIVEDGSRLLLSEKRAGRPPVVSLDSIYYQKLEDFEGFFRRGVPSLQECESLKVVGPVDFEAGVVCQGAVEIRNGEASSPRSVVRGVYKDVTLELA